MIILWAAMPGLAFWIEISILETLTCVFDPMPLLAVLEMQVRACRSHSRRPDECKLGFVQAEVHPQPHALKA